MSFDDYANHIYQKHRLCIALVIIKTKPPYLTTHDYIKQLHSKMADSMDLDDVTVCSEDFMANYTDYDESFNILRDVEDYNEERYVEVTIRDVDQKYEEIQTPNPSENLTQNTYYNSQSQDISRYIQTIKNLSEQNTFHTKDRNINSPNNCYTKNFSNTNNDETTEEDSVKLINNTKTFEHTLKTLNNDTNGKDNSVNDKINNDFKNNKENIEYDSQNTIPYTLYGFSQNDSHYSQSQIQISLPNNYLYGFNNKRVENNNNKDNNIKSNMNIQFNIDNKSYETDVLNENQERIILIDKTMPINMACNKNNDQTIETYNKNFNTDNDVTNLFLENSININDDINESYSFNSFNNNNGLSNNIIENSKDSQIFSKNTIELSNNSIELSKNSKEFSNNSKKNSKFSVCNENINEDSHFDATFTNLDTYNLKNENKIYDITPKNRTLNQNMERETFFYELDSNFNNTDIIQTSTTDLIPYKVLEELNKIKIYLRRKERRKSIERYSTDSGYRSDSQSRTFNRNSLQSSGISINQSAYSLFNHIMQCPLVAVTRDITSEIAQTLSDLIDRLHDEQTYPPFLEELLDTVDILIRQVYKSKNTSESEFLNKDEFIQRALLLNKSIHIQKHCIEKITKILVDFHEKITDINVTYELTNLDEIENMSYIFNILEILIKKYMKHKNILSQNSTEMSQEDDKIFKRSSITDLWRRKWNTNIRETRDDGLDDRYVLINCSEILNKIVVDCMNSYSLVAFSALKCFNTMQS